MDIKVGDRVKLTGKMINPNSTWMPEESLPVGSLGTVTRVNLEGSPDYHQISVRWDCGRSLAIAPYLDKFEVERSDKS